jgi:hypothetical protein
LDEAISQPIGKQNVLRTYSQFARPKVNASPCVICQSDSLRFELHHGLKCTFSMHPMS